MSINMNYSLVDVVTTFPFIKKCELYKTVKPYGADFYTDSIPRSNLRTHRVDGVKVTDMRGLDTPFTYEANGFEVLPFKTSLPYEGFAYQDKVEEIYCQELGAFLLKHFKASAVQIFEAQVV
jgi:hypothetical protein